MTSGPSPHCLASHGCIRCARSFGIQVQDHLAVQSIKQLEGHTTAEQDIRSSRGTHHRKCRGLKRDFGVKSPGFNSGSAASPKITGNVITPSCAFRKSRQGQDLADRSETLMRTTARRAWPSENTAQSHMSKFMRSTRTSNIY